MTQLDGSGWFGACRVSTHAGRSARAIPQAPLILFLNAFDHTDMQPIKQGLQILIIYLIMYDLLDLYIRRIIVFGSGSK